MRYVMLTGLARAPNVDHPERRVLLVPKPRIFTILPGTMEIPPSAAFLSSDKDDTYLLGQINEEVSIFKHVPLKQDTRKGQLQELVKMVNPDLVVKGKEGFHLETIDDALIIAANEPAGLFYGIQLLYQLLIEDGGRVLVPRIVADDEPRMAIRGLSQDISRGQSPNVEAIKRHIKIMSRFRLNMYQFYIEDMFAFKKYPQIGQGRGPLTPKDVKEIEAFARQYHVEIVPIFQNLSHMENMLLDPEIKQLGEYPGAGSLDLSNPRIYDFLRDLFAEIAPVFTSTRFHIGCDESWDVGTFKSQEFIEKKGMGKALLDHYSWIINELKKHGKKTFFLYHDISFKYDEVLNGLPKENAIMVFWEYSIREDWPDIDRIASFKVPFVVSSSALCWMTPFPDLAKSFLANKKIIDNGLRKKAIGQINSAWGDTGQENFHENNLLAFCFSSAYSWNNEGFDDAVLVQAYCKAVFGITSPKLRDLFSALSSIHSEFPARYLRHWLGFLWRHPYHSPALDNIHPTIPEDDHMDVHDDLIYHEGDMKAQEPLCDKIIALAIGLKGDVKRNAKQLEYFEFAGRLLRYFIHKIQGTATITNMCKDGVNATKAAKIQGIIEPLIVEIKDLRMRFEDLWLHCASRPMVDRILRFYDWQVYWQQQKIDQVKAGIAWKNPYIDSEWLVFPEQDQHQDARYFRTVFEMQQEEIDNMTRANVELVPGNHALLWLNGKEVGSAQCSYQNAAPVIDHNIEAWDIKALLKPGKNVVAVKATNFMFGQPIINVYAEIGTRDGSVRKLRTDKTWRSFKNEAPGWNMEASFDDSGWVVPVGIGKPPKVMGEISLPRFDVGWISKHSHHGFCRILRHKKSPKLEQPLDMLVDITFYGGNVL